MKLSIIIISWQVREQLYNCLQSIFIPVNANLDLEVLVVDNNSQDGTVEMAQAEWPQVRLIANQQNLGFSRAVNQAWQQAGGSWVLLLNPDMKLLPDTLVNLITWINVHSQADSPTEAFAKVGVVSGKLLTLDNKVLPQVRRLPTFWDQAAIILKLPHLFPKILNHYLCADFDYGQEAIVDSVRGSFFCVNSQVAKLAGYLDERYFIWFEEVDYCRALKTLGCQVWYTPTVQAIDLYGKSFAQVPFGRKQQYFKASMLQYFAKWQGWWPTLGLRLLWWLIWPVSIFVWKK